MFAEKAYRVGSTLRPIYTQGNLFTGRSHLFVGFSQAALLPVYGFWLAEKQKTHLQFQPLYLKDDF